MPGYHILIFFFFFAFSFKGFLLKHLNKWPSLFALQPPSPVSILSTAEARADVLWLQNSPDSLAGLQVIISTEVPKPLIATETFQSRGTITVAKCSDWRLMGFSDEPHTLHPSSNGLPLPFATRNPQGYHGT